MEPPTHTALPVDLDRLVLAFSDPHWPKPCTTKELADIAKMTKREAANKLRALAKRGVVRQWHTDPSGQRRYGCVCWSLCQNTTAQERHAIPDTPCLQKISPSEC
jgi:hypothetical protein